MAIGVVYTSNKGLRQIEGKSGITIEDSEARGNFSGKFSGSLTTLVDGSPFIVAGTGMTSVTSSLGSVTLYGLGGGTSIFTGSNGVDYHTPFNVEVQGILEASGGISGSLTKLTDGTSYMLAGPNMTVSTGSSGAVTLESHGIGNCIDVDLTYGDDATGAVGRGPFRTITGAIDHINAFALTGTLIRVMPGVHNLTHEITIPATTAIRGASIQTTTIQMLNVTGSTTLVTMGSNTRLEDVNIKLTSTQECDLIGIRCPTDTGTTSKLRTAVVTVDNSSVHVTSSTNVYAVMTDGTTTSRDDAFSFNFARAITFNVLSNGSGSKAVLFQPTSSSGNHISLRDVNMYVAKPTDLTSVGTYVGILTNDEQSLVIVRSTSISSPVHTSAKTNADVKIITTNNVTLSGTQTLQSVALIANDRVLTTAQSSAINNGIWSVNSGAWSRAADLPVGSNASGVWVFVASGTFKRENWLCISNPATVGTDSLEWIKSFTGADIHVPVMALYTGSVPSGTRPAQGSYYPSTDDRILLIEASDAKNNGCWSYNPLGSWTRSLDMSAGSNSLNAYVRVVGGDRSDTAWLCTTTGTVGTSNLTFAQRRFAADVLQPHTNESNSDVGVQIGPGTDLLGGTVGGRSFTPSVYPTTLNFGLNGNITPGTFYLWPGVQTSADSTQVFWRARHKTIVYGIAISVRTTPGVDTVKVIVLKSISGRAGSAVPTLMSASITNGTYVAENNNVSVEFEQGTYLALQVVSDGSVVALDLTAQISMF